MTRLIPAACLLSLVVGSTAASAAPGVQELSLTDTSGLVERNVKAEIVEFLGRKAVKLTSTAPEGGFAAIAGSDFQDGTIEMDVAVRITTPPGVRMPGFIGAAFRARPDASHYELVYIRPGNAGSTDQAMRNHSVQYCAEPGFGWYELRRAWPSVYEAYADIQPDAWTHLRIEVAGRSMRLYLNGGEHPALVVDGMKGDDLRGAVALWGYAGEEAYFSNVRVTTVAPQPVANGSDAAGTWQVTFNTDTGPFKGTLQLRRDGTALSGTWAGDLGDARPVTGTWRNGYIELSFPGEWPKDRSPAAPGTFSVMLAGWIDGDAGKGRVAVDRRTDGQWTAARTR